MRSPPSMRSRTDSSMNWTKPIAMQWHWVTKYRERNLFLTSEAINPTRKMSCPSYRIKANKWSKVWQILNPPLERRSTALALISMNEVKAMTRRKKPKAIKLSTHQTSLFTYSATRSPPMISFYLRMREAMWEIIWNKHSALTMTTLLSFPWYESRKQ